MKSGAYYSKSPYMNLGVFISLIAFGASLIATTYIHDRENSYFPLELKIFLVPLIVSFFMATVYFVSSYSPKKIEGENSKPPLHRGVFCSGLMAIIFSFASISLLISGGWASPYNITFGENSLETSLKLAELSAILFILIFLIHAAYGHYRRVYFTSWWEPSDSAPGDPLNWKDVKNIIHIHEVDLSSNKTLTKFSDNYDPLWHKPRARKNLNRIFIRDIFFLFAISTSGLFAFLLILSSSKAVDKITASTLLPGGIITSIAAALFAIIQLRAKVRSENRQKWINELRDLMSPLIGQCDRLREMQERNLLEHPNRQLEFLNREKDIRELADKINPDLLKLEMMLNPSEREHRALITLFHQIVKIDLPKVDGLTLHKLGLSRKAWDNEEDQDSIIRPVHFICHPESSDNTGLIRVDGGGQDVIPMKDLISMIVRIAHVVLKREWERVKHAQ